MQQCELGEALSAAVSVDADCEASHCQKLWVPTVLAKAALALPPSREAAAGDSPLGAKLGPSGGCSDVISMLLILFLCHPPFFIPFGYCSFFNVPQSSPHGEGNGTPPQYSCLENPMDRGAW